MSRLTDWLTEWGQREGLVCLLVTARQALMRFAFAGRGRDGVVVDAAGGGRGGGARGVGRAGLVVGPPAVGLQLSSVVHPPRAVGAPARTDWQTARARGKGAGLGRRRRSSSSSHQ